MQRIVLDTNCLLQIVDDNKFVDCAIAASAKYIVSNDSHFNILKEIEWPEVIVMKLKEYFLSRSEIS